MKIVLKSVVIIILSMAISFIFVSATPYSYAELYINETPDFSINFPTGWIVDNSGNFYDDGISFSDKYDWSSMIQVFFSSDVGEPLSDIDELNYSKNFEQEYCEDQSFSNDGMRCFNFEILNEFDAIREVDGYRASTIAYSYTKQYDDPNFPGNYPMIGTTTSVLVGNDVWDITSESDSYVFDRHHYDIIETAKSFRLSDFSPPSAEIFTPQSGKIYKIYFDPLPEWAINNVNQSLTEASNYWYDKDGVKFQRVYNENDSDFQVYWTKNYGHPLLGYNYYDLIEIGLGDDECAAQWQPFSQNSINKTITHEIGHALGHDHSNDPNDVMYATSDTSYEYEKYVETTMLGYVMAYPVCTNTNGVTYDYQLNSISDHTYDVFYVSSISEYEKYVDGYDYRGSCFKNNIQNTHGSCQTNYDGVFVVYVTGGSKEILAEYEFIASETNVSSSDPLELPTITKNEELFPDSVSESIGTSSPFYKVTPKDFTTITISGFIPEQVSGGGYPVYLTITFGGDVVTELKLPTTNIGYFNTMFQLPPDASFGTYLISGNTANISIGSTSFRIGLSDIELPPSSISNEITSEQTNFDSSMLTSFKSFSDDEYDFTINYPTNWVYEKNYVCANDEICMLSFSDDHNYWSVEVNVNLMENGLKDYSYFNDKQYLDDLLDLSEEDCVNSLENVGYSCSDYKLINLKTNTINGQKGYQIQYSWIVTYDDESYEKLVTIITEFPLGDDYWEIYSETKLQYSDYNLPLMKEMISSFQLTTPIPSVTPSVTQSDSTFKKYIDEDFNTFSIEYPDDWVLAVGHPDALAVFDDQYDWKTDVQVFWNEDDALDNRSDSKVLRGMETVQWEICSDETFAVGDRKCSDFKVVDSYTIKTNDNRKLYFVETAYTLEWKEYLPGKENSIISTIGIIFDGDGSWEITSESFEFFNGKQVFANHSDEIIHMMKSFSLNPNIQQQDQPTTKSIIGIPSWIKNNAGWWAEGAIDDDSFIQGIQFLIKEGIIEIPPTTQGSGTGSNEIPSWIKNNAGWWADGVIDDDSFVQGIQFLIKEGIMPIS